MPSARVILLARAGLAIVLGQLVCCTSPSAGSARGPASTGATGRGKLVSAALRPTAIAAVRQPITTTKLGLAILWQRPRELIRANLPASLVAQPPLAVAPGTPAFEALLDRKRLPPAQAGTLRWLVDGKEFFPALARQIAAAQRSIQIQLFIFDNDDVAVRYADQLKRRADQVRVQVLFDDMGSNLAHTAAPMTSAPRGFQPPVDMRHYLTDGSRVEVRLILTPWLAADHTKLLLFDGRTAMLGGMNLGREYYSEWHDVMVEVEGPVVGSLSRAFQRTWRKAGPLGDLALLRQPSLFRRPRPVTDGIPLRVLRTDPAEGRHEILTASLLAIRGARQRIWIETPYFASDEIAQAVAAAARRGVQVRVVLPAAGDSALMNASNMATARGLVEAGAKVYHYPRMNHTKLMICDDWASFGSANLDTLSLRINRELNLAFADPAAVREVANRVFLPDCRRSRRVTIEPGGRLLEGLAETLADQL